MINEFWNGAVIPPEKWARDHYTTIAYAFTRAGAPLDKRKLRTDSEEFPTRLKDGIGLRGHDDINCLDDAIVAGVLVHAGTGANPMAVFTPAGLILGQWLRYKIDAGGFNTMELTWADAVQQSECGLVAP